MGGNEQIELVDRLIEADPAIAENTASTNLVGRVVAAAVARGASRPALLEAAGISEAVIRNQLNRVPAQVLIDLFAAIERQTGNPAAALEIGRDSRPSCFSDIGFATRMLPNLQDVLTTNIHLQVLRQNLFRVSLGDNDDAMAVCWNILHHHPSDVAAVVEFSVSTYLRLAREIVGPDLRIKAIRFQHRPRFPVSHYVSQLSANVLFGSDQTMLLLDREQCLAPSPSADPILFAEAARRHRKVIELRKTDKRYAATAYFYAITELNKSPVTLDRLARSFGLTERTLRRHLVREGYPFRELLDDVRKDLCDLYRLENRRPLNEIALLLGYGELSAFTRAYRRWYGQAPSTSWRNVVKGKAAPLREAATQSIGRENGGRSKD